MNYWFVLFFLFSFFTSAVFAQDTTDQRKTIIIGHNVTPTTEIPKQGTWTLGSYAAGYAFTDNLFIATSPWIWLSYNTGNIHAKWVKKKGKWSYGAFASYFKSYNSTPLIDDNGGSGLQNRPPRPGNGGPNPTNPVTPSPLTITTLNRYEWESANTHLLMSYEWTSDVKTNFNFQYGYYFNDEFAYSIRMDPGDDSIRDQIDVTTLTSVRFNENWGVLLEFGGLGLNYIDPYMQSGMSFFYQGDNWFVQLGASYTAAFSELDEDSAWEPGRYDSRLHYSESQKTYYYYRYLQTALHPEIQIQFSF